MIARSIGIAICGFGLTAGAVLWLASAPSPGRQPDDLAAAGLTPLNYGERFERELGRVGQISTKQFAEFYPAPEYLSGLTWDPTTAKFFDKINVEKVVKKKGVELAGYKLNADEMTLFKKNGFVVSERLGTKSFGGAYYDIYTRDLPVFITSDSVLHAWHRSYDAMLAELETEYFKPALGKILAGMHAQVAEAGTRCGQGVLKESIRDADYFLAVARSLLTKEATPTVFDQGPRVDQTLAAVQKFNMQNLELFGRPRVVDFSQFKPRGRYNGTEAMQNYFRAMMWLGRIDLRVAGLGSSPRELGSAVVLFDLLQRSKGEADWRDFDRLLTVFIGRVDSATFADLGQALRGVGRTAEGLRTEADLKNLAESVASLGVGKQEVRGDVFNSPPGAEKIVLPRSFTVLGPASSDR